MRKSRAFTLLEVLVALAILGVLGMVFVRIFISTLDASSNITSRNDLLHEAQIAEQIIASRVRLAWYVYPPGTRIKMNNGWTTKNALQGSSDWVVGTDPIVAMVVPPKKPYLACSNTNNLPISSPQGCYMFYAYYAFPRSYYVTNATGSERLDPDARNDNTWVLMELRSRLYGFSPNVNDNPSCTNTPIPNGGLLGYGRLLVEYVQPETDAPNYSIFSVLSDGTVELRLRMRKKTPHRTVVVPPTNDAPLTLRVSPRNLRVGCK